MGSQWPGMGADLMHLPVFANAINEIDTYLKPLGIDIVDVITNFDPMVLRNIVHSFVGIAAIQVCRVLALRIMFLISKPLNSTCTLSPLDWYGGCIEIRRHRAGRYVRTLFR